MMHVRLLFTLTVFCCIVSCEMIRVESYSTADIDAVFSASPDNYRVTSGNASDLVRILYPTRNVSEQDYIIGGLDTLVYIFNFDDGWIAISGDKRFIPIIGLSETGQLRSSGNSPGIDVWLNSCADLIRTNAVPDKSAFNDNVSFWKYVVPKGKQTEGKTVQTRSSIEDDYFWVLRFDYEELESNTLNYSVPHLMNTAWGQGSPWNYKCPIGIVGDFYVQCPTGCSAVAMAQVIYYMHYFAGKPDGLYHDIECSGIAYNEQNYTINFSRGNYTANSPRWGLMALNRLGQGTEYVGDLMMDVGNWIGMTYSGSGSGAFPSNSGFSHYSLSCSNGDYSVPTINSNLSQGRPVIVVAYANKDRGGVWPFRNTIYSEGHTWVIDGRAEREIVYKRHYHWTLAEQVLDTDLLAFPFVEKDYYIPEVYEGMTYTESRTESSDYFLMNWGADGYGNEGLYTWSTSSWSANNKCYQYNASIYYDIQ